MAERPNWRVWMAETLVDSTVLTEVLDADDVYGAGSLQGSPAVKPFAVIKMDPSTPARVPGARVSQATLSVHDNPGAYDTIDAVLRAAEAALAGQVALPGAICCTWAGDTQDLADESLGTIYRQSTYTLMEGPPS